MPIAEVRVPILIGKVERSMYFNLNTQSKYQELTVDPRHPDGKLYYDTLAEMNRIRGEVYAKALQDALKADPTLNVKEFRYQLLPVLRNYSMRDVLALLAAAVHEYDAKDEPKWPFTPGQIGRYFGPQDCYQLIVKILDGHNSNTPTEKELGEANSAGESSPAAPAEAGAKPHANGGAPSTVLAAEDFG